MKLPRILTVAGSMAAAGGLAAIFSLTPAGAAISAVSPVSPAAAITLKIGDTGRIADRGLTAYIPVTITCNIPGAGPNVYVTVRERVGNWIASANGYTTIPCTGKPTVVTVRTDAYTVPFKKGKSIVDASAYVCFNGSCVDVAARKEVRLR